MRTPLMYPDGGIIDVYVTERGAQYCVTDFGETLGWLRMQTASPAKVAEQNRMIEDACQTLGVRLDRGQLTLRTDEIDSLAEAVLLIAQAALRVSDLWFTLRTQRGRDLGRSKRRLVGGAGGPFRKVRAGAGAVRTNLVCRLSDPHQRTDRVGVPADHGFPRRIKTHCGTCSGGMRGPQPSQGQPTGSGFRIAF